MAMNDHLRRICKEVTVAYYKPVCQHFCGGNERKSSVTTAGTLTMIFQFCTPTIFWIYSLQYEYLCVYTSKVHCQQQG